MIMKKLALASFLAAAVFSSSVTFADTLSDTDNHAHDNAYNVNQPSEFFGYFGIRAGLNSIDAGDKCDDKDGSEAIDGSSGNSTTIYQCNGLSHKEGFFGSPFIGIGYRQNRWGVRAEFEANFNQNKTWSNDIGIAAPKAERNEAGEVTGYSQVWYPGDVTLKSQSYMLNFYGDAYATKNSVFYVMGGIGLSHLDLSVPDATLYLDPDMQPNGLIDMGSKSTRKTHLAYQVGIGAQYYPINHLGLDLGVRYQDLGKVDSFNISTVQVYLGALTRF